MLENYASKNIVLIDDDFIIRQVIKSFVSRIDEDIEIYSSANGVEGLGFVITTNPRIIIIDTTLPKYSGRELIDYLTTNPKFTDPAVTVIVIQDRRKKLKLPDNYLIINKKDRFFLDKLVRIVGRKLTGEEAPISSTKLAIGRNAIRCANRSDLLMSRDGSKLIKYIKWLDYQVAASIYLTLIRLFIGKGNENYVEQKKYDLMAFRVRYYPTLATILMPIMFTLLQVGLFMLGGMTLLNLRIESIFALGQNEVNVDFTKSEYDATKIEVMNGEIRLKELVQELEPEIPTEPDETTTVEITTEETTVPADELPDVSDEPRLPEQSGSEPEAVLGAETERLASSEQRIAYPTDNPSITFTEPIKYTKLLNILELSSVNNFQSSGQRVMSGELSAEPVAHSPQLTTQITYQISPNNTDWYYYGGEDTWEKTTVGYSSSNTIQEVNEYLHLFDSEVEGERNLYIRAYLHSDGETQVTLNKLLVVRELYLVSEKKSESQAESGGLEELAIEEPASLVFLKPIVLNAAYANGNKVVSGRVELDDGVTIPDEELSNYQVIIYYTTSTDITKPATSKGEEIGTAPLQRITINGEVQYVFELRTPSSPGGYVTAEVCYGRCAIGDEPSTELTARRSQLSAPVENATFTVSEAGDQADSSAGDGSCDWDAGTPGSQCTLRAAIQEANALAGADNIYFNIPTSDPGYRDYDDPDTPGSGDGIGQDDYWTIRPGSALPNITQETHIDGATQATNQFDSNTEGPEIEIDGRNAGNVNGFNFSTPSTNSLINSLVINNWSNWTRYGVVVSSNNFLFTNNYMGVDIKGQSIKENGNGIQFTTDTSNITIENNLIAGSFAGISLQSASNVFIKKNIIGLNKDQTTILGSSVGVTYANSDLTVRSNIIIGGDNPQDGNIIGGCDYAGINYQKDSLFPPHTTVSNFVIKNNVFGTDITGTNTLSNRIDFYMSEGSKPCNADITIRDNTFRNAQIIGISLSQCQGMKLIHNDIQRSGWWGIYLNSTEKKKDSSEVPFDTPGDGPLDNEVIIEGNIIKNNGISTVIPTAKKGGIQNQYGSSSIIRGNEITSNTGYGIFSSAYQNYSRTAVLDPLTARYYYSRPLIGGTGSLINSACHGSEQNCISNNTKGGILSIDSAPWNENTLYTDNDFSGGNGVFGSISQVWTGLFEVLSSNFRRTDIPDGNIGLTFSSEIKLNTNPDGIVTYGQNYTKACLVSTDCPNQAITNSNGNTSFVGPMGFNLSDASTWYYITEYTINNIGQKIDHGLMHYDENHIASQNFSFDGNSTTNPINTASSRTITVSGISQTYTDRGEPWTDNITANKSSTGVNPTGVPGYEYVFGNYQIMEVELVDANPVLQDDGSYVITVDSTTNEDNVSLSGYDDGGGAYSGGGNNGPDGLPNGKTSLKEATIVANNHAGVDYIYFNIPVNDTSHVCYQDDGVAGQVSAGNIVATTVKDNPNCGGTSIDLDYPYSWFDLTSTGTLTLAGPTIIDGYTQEGAVQNTAEMGQTLNNVIKIDTSTATFTITGGGSTIAGIALTDGSSGINLNADNYKVQGIYMGAGISGLASTGSNHRIFIRGSNGILGSDLDGVNDTQEINIINNGAIGGTTVTIPSLTTDHTKINQNYINTDRKGTAANGNFVSYSGVVFQLPAMTSYSAFEVQRNLFANAFYGITQNGWIPNIADLKILDNRFGTDWTGVLDLNNPIQLAPSSSIGITMNGDVSINGIISQNIFNNYYLASPSSHSALFFRANTDDLLISHNIAKRPAMFTINGYVSANNVTFIDNIMESSDGRELLLSKVNSGIVSNNYFGEGCNKFGDELILIGSSNNISLFHNTVGLKADGLSSDDSLCSTQIYVYGTSIGVHFYDNIIAKNSNTNIAIDLNGGTEDSDGITANDEGDIDIGPNDLQNYPIITKIEYLGAGQYRISGDLDENPSEASFDIEICESSDHASGHGGCLQTLGHVTANSPWQTIVTVPGSDGTDGVTFSTLATNTNGSTSEFGETIIADETNPDYEIIEYDVELVYPIDGIEIDDRTPQLDWNPAVEAGTGYLDPDIHHYEIYLDGSYYTATDDAITQYSILTPLALGTHTWQVVAFRQLGDGSFVETARSNIENFVIVEANYTFTPIYPVDVTIDDTTPLFDWGDLDPSADFDEYDLYIDDELVAQGLTESEFQLAQSSQLTADSHTWYVIAIRIEPDGSRTEVGRTETAKFTIYIPEVKPPDTGDGKETVPPPPEKEQNRIELLMIDPIVITVPLVLYLLLMGAASGIGSTSLGDFLLKLGVLFGVVIKRKKKYWGVVFDAKESKPIPFAVVRLLREDNSLIKQTVTDLEGRYGLVIDEKGIFTLDVAASGYNSYQTKINVPAIKAAFIGQEVVEDVPLLKTGEHLNPFKKLYCYSKPQLLKGFRVFTVVLMFLGFLWSVYATWKSPHIINFIILGIYAILFGLNLYEVYKFRRRNAGRVIDESTGEGIGGVGVRVYEEGKQLEMVLSSSDGYLKFNFKPGVYDFYANKDGYVMATKNNQPLQRIQLDAKGMLEEDIKMKR